MTLFTGVAPQGSLGSPALEQPENKDVSSWIYASSPQILVNLLNYHYQKR